MLKRWDQLTGAQRQQWRRNYGKDAQDVWERVGRGGSYRVAVGYIMDDGQFVSHAQFHQLDLCGRGFMMIFQLKGSTNE